MVPVGESVADPKHDCAVARILLVDDESLPLEQLKVAARGKAGEKRELVTTNSFAQAIELITKEPFDLIVTDMRVPGNETAGLELLREARQIAPDVPVIVVTANPSMNRSRLALEGGAFDYLDRNPVGIDHTQMLRHKITQALEVRAAKRVAQHVP